MTSLLSMREILQSDYQLTIESKKTIINSIQKDKKGRESKQHLFVVDSLDKHMQNEKELIRLRRFMPAARTTRTRSAQFRLRRELPCTRVVGGSNFACGANYPHQALKGGYFVFVRRE